MKILNDDRFPIKLNMRGVILALFFSRIVQTLSGFSYNLAEIFTA